MKKFLSAVIFLSFFFFINSVFAQVPVLSYAGGAQSYTAGKAITPLALSSSGGAIPAGFYGQVLPFVPGTYVTGMAMDTIHKILYITNGDEIEKVSANGVMTLLAGNTTSGANNGTGSGAAFYNPQGLAVDAAGYVYVADGNNNVIRKISPYGVVTTLAGSGVAGKNNATGTAATFSYPTAVAVDRAGNVYVADQSNELIRKITPAGVVTTLAGSGTAAFADGTGSGASFNSPQSLIVDIAGNIYVSDESNQRIRKITPAGVVSTLAGSGNPAYADGTGSNASFYYPSGLAFDVSGNIMVADYENSYLRKVTPAGVVTTIANLSYPTAIAADANGNLFIASSSSVVKVPLTGYALNTPLPAGLSFDPSTGNISGTPLLAAAAANFMVTGYNISGSATASVNIAVTGTITVPPPVTKAPNISYTSPPSYAAGTAIATLSPTNTNGGAVPAVAYGQTNTLATLNYVTGIAMDASGNVYVNTGTNSNQIKKITPSGVMSVFAGTVSPGAADGTGTAASFNNPQGLAIDASGNLYVADAGNNLIRKITPAGVVTTLAGNGTAGFINGSSVVASFSNPTGIAVDVFGNVYVADNSNYAVRMISSTGVVSTLAGNGTSGVSNGTGAGASFGSLQGIVADAAGNVYVADQTNELIRKISPAGVVTTFAGSGTYGAINNTGTAASFYYPYGLTIDAAGNLFVGDEYNYLIRRITPAGVVSTVAGGATGGAVDGIGISASFTSPTFITNDGAGNLYVSDGSNTVRRVSAVGFNVTPGLPVGLNFDPTNGNIAGTPTLATTASNYVVSAYNIGGSNSATVNITVTGTATVPAIVAAPVISYTGPQTYTTGMAISPLTATNTGGTVPATTFGQVSTFAGTGATGRIDGPAATASFYQPGPAAMDAFGNLYVYDQYNYLIRKISPSGIVSTFAGSGGSGSVNGTGSGASFSTVMALAVDASGNVYAADETNQLIRKITPAGVVTTLAGSGTPGFGDGLGIAASFDNPTGIAVDASGNVFVADNQNNLIRKITPAGAVTTFAGSGTAATTNGIGINASFYYPNSIAIDMSGNLFVTESYGNDIREVTPSKVVTTFAGNALGTAGAMDGTGTGASFNGPDGIAADKAGNLYVLDLANNLVRKITSTKVVSTLAGNVTTGHANNIGTQATFNGMTGIAADATGNVFVTETTNNDIRKIAVTGYTIDNALPAGLTFDGTTGTISGTPTDALPSTTYTVTAYNGGGSAKASVAISVNGNAIIPPTVAPPNISYASQSYTVGNTISALTPSNSGGAVPAQIYAKVTTLTTTPTNLSAYGLAVDPAGNLYAAGYAQIFKINAAGVASVFAGSGTSGLVNGKGTAASFSLSQIQQGMAFDAAGNLYLADNGNNVIRKISPSAVVSTFAGKGTPGAVNGAAVSATFSNPTGIAVDLSGNVYVADPGNYLVREITPAGVVSTLAGNVAGGGTSTDGTGPTASFSYPQSVAVDPSGNVYVADGNEIRKIAPGGVVTTLAGSSTQGETDGTGIAATFSNPYGLTVDAVGNIYATDNYTVRKITPAGVVTTIAGSSTGTGSGDGVGAAAQLGVNNAGIAIDGQGNLYTADGSVIRKVSIAGYTLNSTLPAGLVFDATTGTVSGTPVLATAQASYSVTAYNIGGNSTANINITVTGILPVIPPAIIPPSISYTPSANSYMAGTAISSLVPANTGGAVPATIYGKTTTLYSLNSITSPNGVGVDASGNLYVTDSYNIYTVNSNGVPAILAGNGTTGFANGLGTAASFSSPGAIAIDAQGNKYVADYNNAVIRKITPAGLVSTFAGNGKTGYIDGPGATAEFSGPSGVAVDSYGNVYVSDTYNNVIRKITPSGVVNTLAGTTTAGSTNGLGTAASFSSPSGVAVDANGNVYIADYGNYLVRMITPAGIVSTLAGTSGVSGSTDGTGTAARFTGLNGITVDLAGNIYLTDNYTIRKVTPAGLVSTLAGVFSTQGTTDGIGSTARFGPSPLGIAVDQSGNVYVADGQAIRKISAVGYAINAALPPGLSFDATSGTISGLPLLATTAANFVVSAYNMGGSGAATINIGVTGTPTVPALPAIPAFSYITPDVYAVGQAIATLHPTNTGGAVPSAVYGQTSTLAGSGSVGNLDATGATADFNAPGGVATDVYGNVYVGDVGNNTVRRISAAGVVTTVAGSGAGGFANGTGSAASFQYPVAIAVDHNFNIYVADEYNSMIRKITPAGVVTTLAGNGTYGFVNSTNGANAEFEYPTGIAVDASGNVYVADANNQKVRKITPAGAVTTFAGSGLTGKGNGTGAAASFNYPSSLAIDAAGNLYVGDQSNFLIRKITPAGVVTNFAGSGVNGDADGTATSASFSSSTYVTSVDATGNVYLADAANDLVRKVSPAGTVTTIAGNGSAGATNGVGNTASFASPQSVAADNSGNLYIADATNNLIRKITISGYTINADLPDGLSFDGTTGAISGTPILSSANTAYNVTGYNSAGAGNATVNIAVIYPPVVATTAPVTAFASMGDVTPVPVVIDNGLTVTDLSKTTLATATIAITGNFTAIQDVLGFTNVPASMGNIAGVYNSTTGVLTLSSSGATASIAQWQAALSAVTYNNTNNVAPNVANRTISFTASDGTFSTLVAATKTVSLTYTPSHNDNLASLTVSAGTISPVFNAATTAYSFGVNNATGTLTVTAASVSLHATITINGAATQLANSSAAVPLTVGNNIISVTVLAQDGTTTQTYSINVIRAATQTITFASTNSVVYGAADFAPGAVSTNTTLPVTYASSNPAVATIVAGNIHIIGAGTTTITASQAGNINYDPAASVVQTLIVSPATLTITAINQSQVYGAVSINLSYTFSGFVNSDTQASLTTQPTISTTATASSAAGIYPINASAAVDPNYSFTYVAGTFTITQASLTITANNQTKVYGAVNPGLGVTYSGFVNGDSQSVVTTAPTVSTTALTSSSTGTYPITASNAVAANYAINYIGGTLTITPASLTITANSLSKSYGAANPALTATFTGFVNGDSFASLTTQPVLSTTATTNSAVGIYPITVSGATSGNYTITYVPGTLTINSIPITFGTIASQVYGTADFSPGATSSATITYTSSNQAVATIVSGNIHVIAPGITTITANNGSSTSSQMLTVTPAPLTIAAVNQTKVYGTINPTLTVIYTGFVNGDTPSALSTLPSITTGATVSSAVGSYAISASGAVSSKYTISYTTGSLSITGAPLTITANDASRPSGLANPTLTITYAGFVNGDTQSAITTPPTISTTATITSLPGTYPITVSGAVAANYAITYVNGTLTVTAATMSFATIPSKIYGTSDFNPGAVSKNPITYTSSNAAVATIVSGTIHIIGVGSTTITANDGTTTLQQPLTVTAASLTITANNQTKVYGAAIPTLTVSYTGFVNGDTQSVLSTQATVMTTATASSIVGSFPITANGAAAANYIVSYSPGTLTVTPAPLTLTANMQTKVYGTANPLLTVAYAGFVNGDTQSVVTTQPIITTTATTVSPVGAYPITANGAAAVNYTISYVAGSLTVTTATLTVTAVSISKNYGAALPVLTLTYSGFVNGDTQAMLTMQPTISTTATAASGVGSYPITAGGGVSSNYSFTYVAGTLTVTPVTLIITAVSTSKTYGSANPAFTLTYTGFVNNDAQASLSTSPTESTTATTSSGVGAYPITLSGAAGANYAISYVNGTLTVNSAGLTITANNQTKIYGAVNPALTLTYTGLVNGDTPSALTVPATVASTATPASPVGSYPITASGAVAANYSISYVAGSLSVTPATLTVTANNQSKNYGAANPVLTVGYSGFVNGDAQSVLTTAPTITTAATVASGAGSYPITASGAAATNYIFVYVAGSLTIGQATLTVVANKQTKVYGAAIPALTITYSGFVNGDTQGVVTTAPTIITTATTASAVGTYPITASGGSAANYTFAYTAGVLSVTKAPLTIRANNQTKVAGTANPALTVTYTGFVNSETQTVLSIQPSITTTATISSPAGTYPITAGGAAAANYAISYVAGVFTVSILPLPKISYTSPQLFTYGTAITTLTPTNSGGAVPIAYYGFTSTFAGSGAAGAVNASGTAASFNTPTGVVTDASGNLYVADESNNLIRKITSAGVVSTFAGSGASGSNNGSGSAASFSFPVGIAIDKTGNLYVADFNNNMIREITPAGLVSTFKAGLNQPTAVAVDASGNVYEVESGGGLNKITQAGVETSITTFSQAHGVAVDATGNIYVPDSYKNTVYKINTSGVVSVLAGSGAVGSANGTGAAASFNSPFSVAVDAAGYVYITDSGNNLIRKISPAGVVSTLAGNGAAAAVNGATTTASFNNPFGLALDLSNNVYVADAQNNLIRKIINTGYSARPALPPGLSQSSAGLISGTPSAGSPATIYVVTASNTSGVSLFNLTLTVAGPPIISYTGPQSYVTGRAINALSVVSSGGPVPAGLYGNTGTLAGGSTSGAINGIGTVARFSHPYGAVTDVAGNIYIADQANNLIRKLTSAGVVTTFAGSGAVGALDGTGTAASFNAPGGLAADATGNIYVADTGNGSLRMITPAGVVTTIAAAFTHPVDVAIDASGNIYSADKVDNLVQKLTPGGSVSTFATGFTQPNGIAVDLSGNVYVADASNRISKVTAAGTVSIFAGTGAVGATSGAGNVATFNNPVGVKVDAFGFVYVCDAGNNIIRKISSAGVVATLSGSGAAGTTNAIGALASFNDPTGIAIDASNNVYVADANNNKVRKIINAGYFMSLPSGFAISTSGIITGIPAFAAPQKAYNIGAVNNYGRGYATISITINGPPVVAYAGPQTYTTSVGIAPLLPTNTGNIVPVGNFGSVNNFVGTTTPGSSNGTGTAAGFNGPLGIAIDGSGNIYTADEVNNLIRKISPGGLVSTLAGSGVQGAANGTGTAASFNHPTAVAADAFGNVYVADQSNNLIRKITPAGVVTTFAGSGTAGSANGTGILASFNQPTAIALDAAGNLYVTDLLNNTIRLISPSGVVTTFAGSGTAGSANGTGTNASFHYPTGITVDGSGNVYVTDQLNNEIRKITSLGVVTTLAGNGTAGSVNGTGAAATFYNPYAVSADGSGNLYVADFNNNEIRMVSATGVVTTVAGSTVAGTASGIGSAAGFNHPSGVSLDGHGNLYVADYYNNEIRLINVTGYTITPALPAGLGFDAATGQIGGTPTTVTPLTAYTISAFNGGGSGNATLKIAVNQGLAAPVLSYSGPNSYPEGTPITSLTPKNTGGAVPATVYGQVSTFAGNGVAGSSNGTGTAASFNSPTNIAVDQSGNTYLADYGNNLIRKITAAGVVTTLAGSGLAGSTNGTGTAASFNGPVGVAVDVAGNVYVADQGNNMIRMITATGVVTTLAGSTTAGSSNGIGAAAGFNVPSSVAVDASGNVYVADASNNLIRKISAAGVVSTLAGSGSKAYVDGIGSGASFYYLNRIAIDGSGNLYATDYEMIRKITPAGVVTTIAGTTQPGFANGTGTSALFSTPNGLTVDMSGNIYVADSGNNMIREISPAGVVTTFAGYGGTGVTNSNLTSSSFNFPRGLVFDGLGNLYIVETNNHDIRKIVLTGFTLTPALPGGLAFSNTSGSINGTPTAVLGPTSYTVTGYNSVGASSANVTIGVVNPVNPSTTPNIYTVGRVNDPYGTARDATGNLYVASASDNVVYRVDAVTQAVTVYAGTGIAGYSGDGGPATSAQLNFWLAGIGVDASGNLYIGDGNNNRVRKVDAITHNISTIAGTGVAGNSGVGGAATSAQLNLPGGISFDANNNIYIADEGNAQILKIDATTQNVSKVLTGIGFVERMAFDNSGVLYFGDEGKYTINKYNLMTNILTIIGGNGTYGNSGDGGPATSAQFEDPMSVTVDAAGNVYVADQSSYVIRKIDATTQNISTYAGTGTDGYTGDGGSAASAEMGFLTDLIIDNNGYLYVGDNGNGAIRRIGGTLPSGSAPNISYAGPQAYNAGTAIASLSPVNSGGAVPAQNYATVTTFAGTGTIGNVNGTGTAASFNNPYGSATDALGNVYIADGANNVIRKISPAGVVSTFAGSGVAGYLNGTGTAASFNHPQGLASDAAGNIYVADRGNYVIRKISPAGVVTTLAGSGTGGFVNGTGTAASFGSPSGVVVDNSFNVYVSDPAYSVIRKITAAGVVTTLAGSGAMGFINGTGAGASFSDPEGLAIDANGNLYLADGNNRAIRKISPAGIVTTFAGGSYGTADGTGISATFLFPEDVSIDSFGNLYVADGNIIRRITPAGVVSTIAGNSSYAKVDGIGTAASFSSIYGLSVSASNNLYIVDQGNDVIRDINLEGYGVAPNLPAGLTFAGTTGTISGTPANVAPAAIYTVTAENASGVSIFPISISIDNPVAAQAPVISYTGPQTYVAGTAISTLAPTNTGGAVPAAVYAQVTTFAGSGAQGTTNGTGTVASFNNPFALTTDASGNIYVADQRNQLIREITPGGAVTTLAGSGATGAANGAGTAASFNNPSGVAVDASGNVYVGDQTNNLIRKITSAGVVTTFAGSSTHGFVNGTGTAASFNGPTAVAIDNSGNVYVADNGNYAIRKITPAGVVTTLAGSGTLGSANGTGTAASFNNPSGLAVDASGNVYVADQNNQLIRKITPAGVVSTFAGSGTAALVNGTGTAASFDYPIGLTIDPAGNLYVGDYVNQVIRMITPAGVVTTLAGTAGTSGALNGVGTTASFNNPFDVAADKDGNLYVADKSNSLIRKINLTGYTIAPAIGGLAFDGTTGIISGTAKVIFPTTTFSITAYNTAGSSVASLTVTVNPATVNAPVISYAGPQSYPVNTAITTLSPTNTGGAIPVTSSTAVSTFAGSGASGSLNGNGLAATFKLGQGNLAIDNSGNVYVADDANFIVRKITPAGVVTTLAGNGVSGTVDGTGTTAGFGSLRGIAVDPSGNVYVTDYNLLRKITPAGVVTTFAGGGPTINGSSVDGTGTAASFFSSIFGLASDASGNIYVAEPNDGKIRKVTPAGVVTTIISNNSSNALRLVFGLTVDASGNIYGACSFDNVIIKVTQAGVMTIIAGIENSTGSQNGVASTSTFYWPSGITIDASGNLFVAEFGDNLIREISTANIVSTYAGNTLGGLGNSTPVASYFSLPQNLEIDAAGNKYIFDAGNDMIRKIGLTGYTISPALPAGLTIDPNTGVISGTPTVITAATNYTVTAYNSGGTATTVVNIATPTAALAPLNVQTYGAPDFSPQKSKNVVVTYSSDNPAVATIVRGKIHITGVGTSTITTLINGTQQLQTLKVVPAQLIIAINNKVKQEGAAIPKLTVDYAGFVNGETEDVLTAKPIVVTDAQEGSGAGEYLIKAVGAVAPNYEIAYLPGRLTVTPISANNPSQVSVTNEQQDFLVLNEPNVKQAVSPNGDGINDVLLIDNIASFPDNKLVLIGRNGNKIFELEHYDNVNHPFDGRSNINGQLQAPGTYYYLLEYHDKGVLKQKTGFFVLKY